MDNDEHFRHASTRAMELEMDQLIAAGLKQIRQSRGLSIEELAAEAGIPATQLRYHEEAKLPLSIPRLIMLTIALMADSSASPTS